MQILFIITLPSQFISLQTSQLQLTPNVHGEFQRRKPVLIKNQYSDASSSRQSSGRPSVSPFPHSISPLHSIQYGIPGRGKISEREKELETLKIVARQSFPILLLSSWRFVAKNSLLMHSRQSG